MLCSPADKDELSDSVLITSEFAIEGVEPQGNPTLTEPIMDLGNLTMVGD